MCRKILDQCQCVNGIEIKGIECYNKTTLYRIETIQERNFEMKEITQNTKDFVKKQVGYLISILKGKKITILGHDNIDVDSTLSGILMSKLLDFLNIENHFCILEKVKQEETYQIISELIGIDMRAWQEKGEEKNRNLFLVDHYETQHDGTVIGCVDHHPTKQEKGYSFMYVRNSCATAYLIYEMMKAVNYPIGKEEAKMIVVAMMVDTVSFRSSKTIQEEVKQAKILAKEYQLDYEFLERYGLCLTPIEKMTTEQIITNGQKWYNYNGKEVGSSYLQLYGLPEKVQLQKWLETLREKLKSACKDMLVFIIFDTQDNRTYEYQIMKDCIKEIVTEGILSRGKNIMPLIEARYLKKVTVEEKMEEIVKALITEKKTIATMESCTGGQLASDITNVSGASEILKESYVSYCNEAKIKFGVPKQVIDNYTVYSAETALAMAKAVKNGAEADIGVGITGQLGRIDPNNVSCRDNNAWFGIVMQNNQGFVCKLHILEELTRLEKKKVITREIVEFLYVTLS